MKMSNVKCLQEYPEYPKRASIEDPYVPIYFNHSDNDAREYSDPEDPTEMQKLTFNSYESDVKIVDGYPQNPIGRTGMTGRGLLAKWGANFGADAIITKKDKVLKVLLVRRKDTGELAFPGGMVDKDEKSCATAQRELLEETGISLDLENAKKIYEGYVDDPRNTDNAWIESTFYHLHLDKDYNPEFKIQHSEVIEVDFFNVDDTLQGKMFSSHSAVLKEIS